MRLADEAKAAERAAAEKVAAQKEAAEMAERQRGSNIKKRQLDETARQLKVLDKGATNRS